MSGELRTQIVYKMQVQLWGPLWEEFDTLSSELVWQAQMHLYFLVCV